MQEHSEPVKLELLERIDSLLSSESESVIGLQRLFIKDRPNEKSLIGVRRERRNAGGSQGNKLGEGERLTVLLEFLFSDIH